MNTKKPESRDPVDRFIFHVQHSLNLCQQIMQKIENHYDISPDDINWSDVGSAEHVSELLEGVAEFIGIV